MSWGRNFIGDVKHVAKMGEAAIANALKSANNEVNVKVAALETELTKVLGEAFEASGKKVDALGNALTALGLHIESSGHFNADGSGSGTIKITSAVNVMAEDPTFEKQVAEADPEAGTAK